MATDERDQAALKRAADSECPLCKKKHLEFLKLESDRPLVIDID
jgi:hypothetical protein